jgi:hypothetical protein
MDAGEDWAQEGFCSLSGDSVFMTLRSPIRKKLTALPQYWLVFAVAPAGYTWDSFANDDQPRGYHETSVKPKQSVCNDWTYAT